MVLICCFTGVQGGGRVELMDGLADYLSEKGVKVHVSEIEGGYRSIQRRAHALGLSINENTNTETQYYLAVAHMESDIRNRKVAQQAKADVMLSERAVCDVMPYTLNQQTIPSVEKQFVMAILRHHIAQYPVDIYFAPRPLPNLSVSNLRSPSMDYQEKIALLFRKVWQEYKLTVVDIPIFDNDDLVVNQSVRIRHCAKIVMNLLGIKLA